jgi:RND family efflux transporter MFP subunit
VAGLHAGSETPVARVAAEPERVVAEGRLRTYPGAEVVVGTEVRGRIVRLAVQERSVVKAGDLIAELAAADLRASLAEAEARMAEARADITFHGREARRREQLLGRGSASTWELDADLRALDTARARLAAATAQRDRFQADLDKTRILSPIDGVVTRRDADAGEIVDAGAPIVTVTDLSRARIEAEVDEYDTARVRLGAPVRITAEGFPDAPGWDGVIEEIPDTVTIKNLRPEDPGRPIDTRVLLVKIALRTPTPLKLGQRVEVSIAVPDPDAASPGGALADNGVSPH